MLVPRPFIWLALTMYLARLETFLVTVNLSAHQWTSCWTLATALLLQMLSVREILACAVLTLSSWISFPCETLPLLLFF